MTIIKKMLTLTLSCFKSQEPTSPITRALVLAIGVCYHAKLQERREEYRTVVARSFKAPCSLPGGQMQILREISRFTNCFYHRSSIYNPMHLASLNVIDTFVGTPDRRLLLT